MRLETGQFGESHLSLILPEDSIIMDGSGLWGPKKEIPEVGTARIVAPGAWNVEGTLVIDVANNRVVPVEEFVNNMDMYPLVIHLSMSSMKGNKDALRLKAIMPDGNAYESGLDNSGFHYDKEDKEEPYKGLFTGWENGRGQKVTLAILLDPVFLSKIGFSFSRTV